MKKMNFYSMKKVLTPVMDSRRDSQTGTCMFLELSHKVLD